MNIESQPRRRVGLRSLGAAALLAIPSLLLPAVPAARADVLVTRDGARVETRGVWQVKGRLVVFTRADGTLASLRLDDVDLAASEKATATAQHKQMEAPAEPPAAEGPAPRAAMALTDADFRHRIVIPGEAEPEESAAEGGETAERATAPSAPTVVAWEQEEDPLGGHVVLTGRLRNDTGTAAVNVSLRVRLFGEEGNLLDVQPALLDLTSLPPGGETPFQVEFPEVLSFSALKFESSSLNLRTQAAGEESAAATEGEETPEAPETP